MAPRRTCSTEEILAGHAAEVVELAGRVRALVRRLAPSLTEAGYPGWRLIGLRAHGYVGFIAPLPALGLFVFGWILQGVGHWVYEKNSPAFFRNFVHLAVGQLWILAKALCRAGLISRGRSGSGAALPGCCRGCSRS